MWLQYEASHAAGGTLMVFLKERESSNSYFQTINKSLSLKNVCK